jgi:hypothetical protein
MTHALFAILLVAAQTVSYAGKPLGDVLRDLQRRGLNVVFSSEVVKPDMRVASEPKVATPRKILDEVLAPHGLAVRSGPRESLVVVRAPRAPQTPPAPAVVGTVAGPASAQPPEPLLSGVVIRSDSRAPIAGATVAGAGRTTTTNKDGRFGVRLPVGRTTLTVSAKGFFQLVTTVEMTERGIEDAEFALAPQEVFESSVEVLAPSPAPSTSPSATPVAPRDVLKTPGSVDNVFRTLHTLPGVAAPNDFTSRLTVRGGAPDQNLTVMDGVEVHDPFRLFGLASAFNPEIIQHFELATSGFSAKYGDRLSSLLVVENRDGNRARRFGTSGSLSVTDANLVFEGKLPGGAPGSWLVTGRRTYFDLIVGRITDDKFPQFADLQAKAVWEPAVGRRLTFFGLRSRQIAAISETEDENAEEERVQVDDDTQNDLTWLRFDTRAGVRGHSTTVAGYSRTLADFGIDALISTGFTERSNSPFTLEKPKSDVMFSRRLEVEDLSARQEFSWSLGAHTLDAGAELHRLKTYFRFALDGDPGEDTFPITFGLEGLPDVLESRLNSTRVGAWVIDSWRAGARARLETGLRLDRSSINGDTALSPRLAASFAVTPTLSARASFGRYTQSPGYEKTAQSDHLLNFTAESAGALRSERADMASISLEQTIGSGVTARVETYYKRLSNMLMGRLETDAERFARLARYNFPASLAWSLPVEPIVTPVPTNDGRGRAYGIDVVVSRMTAPVNARLRGWVSYTWGKAERDAYDRTYPFEYDRRHAVSAVLSLRASRTFELASTIRWASGFPRTPALGVRVAGEERTVAGATVIVPKRDSGARLVYEVDFGGISNLNTARLPNFARTDVRLTWKPKGPSGRWEFYGEVINLTSRENAVTISTQLAYDPASDRPRIVEQQGDGSIPRVPTIGVRWRF